MLSIQIVEPGIALKMNPFISTGALRLPINTVKEVRRDPYVSTGTLNGRIAYQGSG
jgi:hypothetical protein